jgi:hypothetical protein
MQMLMYILEMYKHLHDFSRISKDTKNRDRVTDFVAIDCLKLSKKSRATHSFYFLISYQYDFYFVNVFNLEPHGSEQRKYANIE